MSETIMWCADKTRLNTFGKRVFRIDEYGAKSWCLNGKLHREDGPAVEFANGDRFWYLDGKQHRVDGPAVEYVNGHKEWYLNDKLHRINGPAFEYANGGKDWWLHGRHYSESAYWKELQK